jgi:hypothetical protein
MGRVNKVEKSGMTKTEIIGEIKRTTEANGGIPLGINKFVSETGIKTWDWQRFWPRWGDAVREAGFAANQLATAYGESELLDKFAKLARELGRLPVKGDLIVKSHTDTKFPSAAAYQRRFGGKTELIKRLTAFCKDRAGFDDVANLCGNYVPLDRGMVTESLSDPNRIGFVYLAKSGRFYKIGKTNSLGRRGYELALQLPEKPRTIHAIQTDDPSGVEAYWHNRFMDKRKGGEFFDLNASDVAAFKKWRKIV